MGLAAVGFLQCVMESLPGILGFIGKLNGGFACRRGLARGCHKATAFVVKLEGIASRRFFLAGKAHNPLVDLDNRCCGSCGRILVIDGHGNMVAARGFIVGYGSILVSLHILDLQGAVHVGITNGHIKIADHLVVGNTANGAVHFGYPEGVFASGIVCNALHQLGEAELVKVSIGRIIDNGGSTCALPCFVSSQLVLQLEGERITILPVTAFQQFRTADGQINGADQAGGVGIGISNVIFTGFNGDRLLDTTIGGKANSRSFRNCDRSSVQKVLDTDCSIRGSSHGYIAVFVCLDLSLGSLYGFTCVLISKGNGKGKIQSIWDRITVTEGVADFLADNQVSARIKTREKGIDKGWRFCNDLSKGAAEHRCQDQGKGKKQRQNLMKLYVFFSIQRVAASFLNIFGNQKAQE